MTRRSTKSATGSAADAFARRWVRRGHFDVVVADPSAALKAVEAAQAALETVPAGEGTTEAQAALDAARADVDACRVRLWFQQPPNVQAVAEEIRTRHPLPDGLMPDKGGDWTSWRFWPAFAAVCAAEAGDDSLSEDGWADAMASWTEAERAELITVLLPVLNKPPSEGLPKD